MVELELCQGQSGGFTWYCSNVIHLGLRAALPLQQSKILHLVSKAFTYLQVTKHFGEENVAYSTDDCAFCRYLSCKDSFVKDIGICWLIGVKPLIHMENCVSLQKCANLTIFCLARAKITLARQCQLSCH